MSRVEIINKSDLDWDKRLLQTNFGSFYQYIEYGELVNYNTFRG